MIYFLSMEAAHSSKGIAILYRKYTFDLLKEMGILGLKSRDVPIDANHKIRLSEKGKAIDRERYQKVIW